MKFNFTLQRLYRYVITCLILSTIGISPNFINAQCSLACTGTVQVSLDMNCEAEITPDMVLNDAMTSCPAGVFEVIIEDQHGVVIPFPAGPNGFPLVDGSLADGEWYVKILDTASGNSCWGLLIVEDKIPPLIECGLDTIPCFEASTITPTVTEACGNFDLIQLNEEVTNLDCDPDFIKIIERSYQAVDEAGNVSDVCIDTIFLERFDFDEVVCPVNFTKADGNALLCSDDIEFDEKGFPFPSPSETGVPTAFGIPLYPNQDFYCNIGVFYTDLLLPTPDCVIKIVRTWEVREWWCNTEVDTTCAQIIEIVDTLGPNIICPSDLTVSTNVELEYNDPNLGTIDCGANFFLPPVQASDNCSEDSELSYSIPHQNSPFFIG